MSETVLLPSSSPLSSSFLLIFIIISNIDIVNPIISIFDIIGSRKDLRTEHLFDEFLMPASLCFLSYCLITSLISYIPAGFPAKKTAASNAPFPKIALE